MRRGADERSASGGRAISRSARPPPGACAAALGQLWLTPMSWLADAYATEPNVPVFTASARFTAVMLAMLIHARVSRDGRSSTVVASSSAAVMMAMFPPFRGVQSGRVTGRSDLLDVAAYGLVVRTARPERPGSPRRRRR